MNGFMKRENRVWVMQVVRNEILRVVYNYKSS